MDKDEMIRQLRENIKELDKTIVLGVQANEDDDKIMVNKFLIQLQCLPDSVMKNMVSKILLSLIKEKNDINKILRNIEEIEGDI